MVDYEIKNKKITLLLCIFGGYLGLHHFYNKQYKKGILYIFTVGLFYIGWIVDIILIWQKKENENEITQNIETINKNDEEIKNKAIIFDCVGESFDNDDGVNRQTRIKQILKNYKESDDYIKEKAFKGYTNEEILKYDANISEFEDIAFKGNFKEFNYKGERAFAIYMNDFKNNEYQIGNIARKDIPKFLEIIENHKIINLKLYVIGGTYKYSNTNGGKQSVATKTFDYGIKMKIIYE